MDKPGVTATVLDIGRCILAADSTNNDDAVSVNEAESEDFGVIFPHSTLNDYEELSEQFKAESVVESVGKNN